MRHGCKLVAEARGLDPRSAGVLLQPAASRVRQPYPHLPFVGRIALPAAPEVDAKTELVRTGNGLFLRARLDVTVPGDCAVAEALVEAAREICPYSKATRGNIEVEGDTGRRGRAGARR